MYPFNLKWLKKPQSIEFYQPLTFFVGDNGVGKSTLIESIAIHSQIPQLTNEPYDITTEYYSIDQLSQQLTSHWAVKSKRGFFFRADDFLRFIRETKQLRNELEYELKRLDGEGVGEYAFERQPYQNSLAALR